MLRAHRELGFQLASRALEPLLVHPATHTLEGRSQVPGDDRRACAVHRDGQIDGPEAAERQASRQAPNENASTVWALDLHGSRAIVRRTQAEPLSGRKRAPDPLTGEHRGERVTRINVPVARLPDCDPFLPTAPRAPDARRPAAAQGLHVVDQLVDVSERRLPPAPPAAQAYAGQASTSFSRACSSASGSTLTSARTGMKFVSPAQRGTTWR